jgi:hypothetical protein
MIFLMWSGNHKFYIQFSRLLRLQSFRITLYYPYSAFTIDSSTPTSTPNFKKHPLFGTYTREVANHNDTLVTFLCLQRPLKQNCLKRTEVSYKFWSMSFFDIMKKSFSVKHAQPNMLHDISCHYVCFHKF